MATSDSIKDISKFPSHAIELAVKKVLKGDLSSEAGLQVCFKNVAKALNSVPGPATVKNKNLAKKVDFLNYIIPRIEYGLSNLEASDHKYNPWTITANYLKWDINTATDIGTFQRWHTEIQRRGNLQENDFDDSVLQRTTLCCLLQHQACRDIAR